MRETLSSANTAKIVEIGNPVFFVQQGERTNIGDRVLLPNGDTHRVVNRGRSNTVTYLVKESDTSSYSLKIVYLLSPDGENELKSISKSYVGPNWIYRSTRISIDSDSINFALKRRFQNIPMQSLSLRYSLDGGDFLAGNIFQTNKRKVGVIDPQKSMSDWIALATDIQQNDFIYAFPDVSEDICNKINVIDTLKGCFDLTDMSNNALPMRSAI